MLIQNRNPKFRPSNKHEKGYNSCKNHTIREIGIICTCSDHGQPRYQIWIKSNKDKWLVTHTRYFRLDYKLSLFIFLLYPHSQSGGYTGIPLSVRPSLNLVCVTSHLSLLDFIHIWYLGWPWSEHVHIIPISMCMLRSWPIKIPNMNKMRRKTND
jgi:hypothetical protein